MTNRTAPLDGPHEKHRLDIQTLARKFKDGQPLQCVMLLTDRLTGNQAALFYWDHAIHFTSYEKNHQHLTFRRSKIKQHAADLGVEFQTGYPSSTT
jgi:hypothetical protein